jgi:hypothetical protein
MTNLNGVDTEAVRRFLSYIGSKGGTARWKGVPNSERSAHARKAARARWGRRKRKRPNG